MPGSRRSSIKCSSTRRPIARDCSKLARNSDVTLEAYSPLGTGALLSDAVVTGIAERLERSPAQVLLRWCVQRAIPVVAKSTHRDRIAENAEVFDLELSADDMEQLDGLDRSGGTRVALERKWW